MASRKPAPETFSPAEQKQQAANEAAGLGDDVLNEDMPLPPPANDGVGNGIDENGENVPASLSMALESDTGASDENGKMRSEMRNLRAERDNYKKQFDDMAIKYRELELKYEGATASNRR
jgi:hypothetical protein